MIDLDSKRELSYYSDFETRSLNILELMESIFGPMLNNPVNIEDSLINENWPRFDITSDVNFAVNSPLVPCILSGVNVKPKGVLKLFCDHPNLTWDHVNNIPSHPLTGITTGDLWHYQRSPVCRYTSIYEFYPSRYELQLRFVPVLFPWSNSY